MRQARGVPQFASVYGDDPTLRQPAASCPAILFASRFRSVRKTLCFDGVVVARSRVTMSLSSCHSLLRLRLTPAQLTPLRRLASSRAAPKPSAKGPRSKQSIPGSAGDVEIFTCERASFFRMMRVATGFQAVFWLFAGKHGGKRGCDVGVCGCTCIHSPLVVSGGFRCTDLPLIDCVIFLFLPAARRFDFYG